MNYKKDFIPKHKGGFMREIIMQRFNEGKFKIIKKLLRYRLDRVNNFGFFKISSIISSMNEMQLLALPEATIITIIFNYQIEKINENNHSYKSSLKFINQIKSY